MPCDARLYDSRAKNLILGALVADTAAMGTHWIYDQAHIARIAPDTPEFIAPDAANYADVPSYFAHATRAAGQTSQYGEQVLVMLDALATNDGVFDSSTYANQFRSHFGYGGAWIGYIDHATRETLNNFQRAEDTALDRAMALGEDKKLTTAMVSKVLALIGRYKGETLRQKLEEAVRISHNDDATVAYGFKVLDTIAATPPRFGAVDQQMPATAKLPPLIASLNDQGATEDAFLSAVETAVRTTSDHPRSLEFGAVCARMMRAALETDDLTAIVDAGAAAATGEPLALLTQARAMLDQDNATVTKHFGMACDLNYGVPSVVHNMLTAPSFTDAIRRNIYAGGDTCGRAIILGSILGAVYGVGGDKGIPEAWIDQMVIDAGTLATLR